MNNPTLLLNTVVLLVTASIAQTAQADAGTLWRETNPIPAPPKPRAEVNIEITTQQQRPPMQPQSNLRVTVQYFSFLGNSQFTNNELQALLAKYKGHSIGFNELQEAANIIAEHYHKSGFLIARAYLPAQKIKNNIVEIVIFEGPLAE